MTTLASTLGFLLIYARNPSRKLIPGTWYVATFQRPGTQNVVRGLGVNLVYSRSVLRVPVSVPRPETFCVPCNNGPEQKYEHFINNIKTFSSVIGN